MSIIQDVEIQNFGVDGRLSIFCSFLCQWNELQIIYIIQVLRNINYDYDAYQIHTHLMKC